MRSLVFRGPVTTASGYGVHARQLLKAILASKQFDVSVQAINWGQTSFIHDGDEFINVIHELMRKFDSDVRAGKQYDVSMQVTIPNEFSKMARVNIGVTAGIEVDRVSPEWIKKANETIDLLIVPSKHSMNVFADVGYRMNDGNILKLQKPVAVVPESIDVSVFNTEPLKEQLFEFDTKFNFLFVGLGLDKPLGEDRKNVSSLITWFCERFKDDKDVGLVLKLGLVNNSLMDFDACKKKIQEFKHNSGCGEYPKIHLVHGRLSDEQLAALYKCDSIKAFISLTHGEGYGLPLIEAAACGLPILATNWSGHLDFLSIDGVNKFIPIDYSLEEIPASAVWNGVMEKGSRWASVNKEDAKLKMKKIVLSYDKPKEWGLELSKKIITDYNSMKLSMGFVNLILDFLDRFESANPKTPQEFVERVKANLNIKDEDKTLLFTMPMSAGDVFASTAVVSSLKKKFPDHRIFFATSEQYKDILADNEDIDSVIQYDSWMADVPLCEKVFDEVYTPNLAIQMITSNWIRGGKGRRLAEEIAAQCHVDLGEYKIRTDDVHGLPEKYVAFHPGSGKGQWSARNYLYWQEVIDNIKNLLDIDVVQIGVDGDKLYDGCIDFRSRTTFNQLAYIVKNANCLVSIDSVAMHMAAAFDTPVVSIFGSSYAGSTGPSRLPTLSVLVETDDRYTCDKACYKYQCDVDPDHPCINEISPYAIVKHVVNVFLDGNTDELEKLMSCYKERKTKLSGYTHIYNAKSGDYPYVESIKSMLGFCDEVVVIEGGSTDGTKEVLDLLAADDDRLKIITHEWDWDKPSMDGMQKAYGRAMCSGDFLWQQDVDEVVHEDDYDKIRALIKRFPTDVDIIHLPVIELWHGAKKFRTDRHSWKWRLSRNTFNVTHGVNKDARVIKDGKTYAKKGMSDGCEYIDIMTGEFLSHKGFYNGEIENLRRTNPERYGDVMNEKFKELPSVFHYSWADVPRKIKNFRDFWGKCWSNLYDDEEPENRFFPRKDPKEATEDEIIDVAKKFVESGNEYCQGRSVTIDLNRSNPLLMEEWIKNIKSLE